MIWDHLIFETLKTRKGESTLTKSKTITGKTKNPYFLFSNKGIPPIFLGQLKEIGGDGINGLFPMPSNLTTDRKHRHNGTSTLIRNQTAQLPNDLLTHQPGSVSKILTQHGSQQFFRAIWLKKSAKTGSIIFDLRVFVFPRT